MQKISISMLWKVICTKNKDKAETAAGPTAIAAAMCLLNAKNAPANMVLPYFQN